ncbi:MAG: hypothetical protein RLZZ232_1716 [Planctomycetota bacterium]|jgi:hypothetical protein
MANILDIQIVEHSWGQLLGGREQSWLTQILQSHGHRTEVLPSDKPPALRNGVLLVLGNMVWYPELRRTLEQTPRHQRPLVVLWHYEPLPPPRASGLPRPWLSLRELGMIALRDRRLSDVYSNYRMLRSVHQSGLIDRLVVTTRGRQDFLAEHGIPSEWIPLGYTPAHGRPLGLERDIDVLFLGTMKVPRRRKIIQRLTSLGLRVAVRGDWRDPACWGEARTELLNRTRILLNFPRTAGEMSGLRFLLGISNQAMVLSEPLYRPDPYIPGRHFVSAAIDELPDVAHHYLQNESERLEITSAAEQHVQHGVTLAHCIGKLLLLMERNPV